MAHRGAGVVASGGVGVDCIALGITTTITAGMALTTITTITTADSGMAICGAVAVVTFIVAAATMAHETTIRV